MTTRRDLTQAQFNAACEREGFVYGGFLGYYDIGVDGVHVCALNAGSRRRSQLAYLIQERNKWQAKQEITQ